MPELNFEQLKLLLEVLVQRMLAAADKDEVIKALREEISDLEDNDPLKLVITMEVPYYLERADVYRSLFELGKKLMEEPDSDFNVRMFAAKKEHELDGEREPVVVQRAVFAFAKEG